MSGSSLQVVNVHELIKQDQPRFTYSSMLPKIRSEAGTVFCRCRGMLRELDQVKQKEALAELKLGAAVIYALTELTKKEKW